MFEMSMRVFMNLGLLMFLKQEILWHAFTRASEFTGSQVQNWGTRMKVSELVFASEKTVNRPHRQRQTGKHTHTHTHTLTSEWIWWWRSRSLRSWPRAQDVLLIFWSIPGTHSPSPPEFCCALSTVKRTEQLLSKVILKSRANVDTR